MIINITKQDTDKLSVGILFQIGNNSYKLNDSDFIIFINEENKRRNHRVELKMKEIEANLRPFSFYDKDEQKYKERLKQECIPPKFIPFKANPIKWRSQVKVEQGLEDNEKARKEKNQKRAQELLAQSSLPPRMEKYQKNQMLFLLKIFQILKIQILIPKK